MSGAIPTWDEYFLAIAEVVRTKSRDRQTKIGAVIVDEDNQIVATGYNGFPRGVSYSEERLRRPDPNHPLGNMQESKYDFFEHAERNAIFAAARRGIPLKGCRLYLAGKHFSCLDCARAIIQTGISSVFMPEPDLSNAAYKFQTALNLFEESGVRVTFVPRSA
jgi:dCMP deaminase